MTINKNDLQKGLAALKAAASNGNELARRNELFAKASNGTITAVENEELIKSLSGSDVAAQATAGLENPELKKSMNVSNFLRDYVQGTQEGLRTLAETIQKSQVEDHGFRIALATTLTNMGAVLESQDAVIKSLTETLEGFGAQPARMAKSRGIPGVEPIAKSFAGQPASKDAARTVDGGEERMTKSQVLDTIDEMHMQKGMTRIGPVDALILSSAVERGGAIPEESMQAIQKYHASKRG